MAFSILILLPHGEAHGASTPHFCEILLGSMSPEVRAPLLTQVLTASLTPIGWEENGVSAANIEAAGALLTAFPDATIAEHYVQLLMRISNKAIAAGSRDFPSAAALTNAFFGVAPSMALLTQWTRQDSDLLNTIYFLPGYAGHTAQSLTLLLDVVRQFHEVRPERAARPAGHLFDTPLGRVISDNQGRELLRFMGFTAETPLARLEELQARAQRNGMPATLVNGLQVHITAAILRDVGTLAPAQAWTLIQKHATALQDREGNLDLGRFAVEIQQEALRGGTLNGAEIHSIARAITKPADIMTVLARTDIPANLRERLTRNLTQTLLDETAPQHTPHASKPFGDLRHLNGGNAP